MRLLPIVKFAIIFAAFAAILAAAQWINPVLLPIAVAWMLACVVVNVGAWR